MKVKLLRVGPIGTNCYILEDDQTNLAAVIDPGDEPELIQEALEKEGWRSGISSLPTATMTTPRRCQPSTGCIPRRISISTRLTPTGRQYLVPLTGEVDDLKLYDEGECDPPGGPRDPGAPHPRPFPRPVTLKVEDVLFTGDTLFAGSCGRTDLRGGSYEQIMQSLKRLGS